MTTITFPQDLKIQKKHFSDPLEFIILYFKKHPELIEDIDLLFDKETIEAGEDLIKREKNNDLSGLLTHEEVWNS